MNCEEIHPLLPLYLDGEFDTASRHDVEEHLQHCAPCKQRLAEERSVLGELRERLASTAVVAPERLRLKIAASLEKTEKDLSYKRFLSAAVATAAVLCVTIVGHSRWQQYRRTEVVNDVVARHARQLPMEVERNSPEQLVAWFGGKLDHQVSLPSFQQNIHPMGARLANVLDKPAAYFRLQNGASHVMGLFVFNDAPHDFEFGNRSEPEVFDARGYRVVSWREGDLVYQLVTDLEEAEAKDLVSHGRVVESH